MLPTIAHLALEGSAKYCLYVFKTETTSKKGCKKMMHPNKHLVLLILSGLYHVCIECKNDVSLYLSVVCFSDCPQPKERDLLLQQIHGISAAEKREIN